MPADYDQLFENNRRWVEKMQEADPDYFVKLASGQHPDYLFIGCSDSRVPANQIMGLAPGDVFVHRNVSNMVVSTDLNGVTVIEYAVRVLKVKHLIVCGHYGCGGVAAAMKSENLGIMNPWLRGIRDVYRMHHQELNAIEDQQKRYDRLVELNVQEQCINLIKMACVQEAYLDGGFPLVHGWVFGLDNGLIKDLDIDFPGILRGVQEIYDLSGSFEYRGAK